MTDVRGIEIKVGDRIIYAGRKGSNIWLTEATVLDLYLTSYRLRVQSIYNSTPVTLKNLHTVAVVGR